MVKTEIDVNGTKKELYMDGGLHHQLTTKVVPSVQKKDFDWFMVVDGEEGAGKSVFGMQIAKTLDPNFNIDQVAFTPAEFISLVVNAKKHQCIVFDEAFTGLSSRSALSEVNQLLVSLMMEMRQKNLFIILIMPTFFMLDKYCVLHRTKGLFHVYIKQGRRGYWNFYNRKRMKMLYLKGKKYYEYVHSKPIIFGRFLDQYTIDEDAYKEKKHNALRVKKRKTKAESYKIQRDLILYGIYDQFLKRNVSALARFSKKWDVGLARRTLNDIVFQREKSLIKQVKEE